MPPTAWTYFATAARFALLEHVRNRLALVLVVLFVPLWISLGHAVVDHHEVRFMLRATHGTVTAHGNDLGNITGALNAVTLIVGFMMFSVTFKAAAFDRRLAMAGYPRRHLLAAKLAALVVVAVVTCAYATFAVCLYWSPRQPWLLALALACGALTYGGLGVMLGALVRGELTGMLLIIMTSIIDTGLQSPLANPVADDDVIRYLPSFGAMQVATTAGFRDAIPLPYLLLGPLWFTGALLVAALAFRFHTRDRRNAFPDG
ncbi:ABC transporter permease [Streptomyces huiliensis]|uniref:ABC transporter permease n=1 Tax=Streptomyces huiliensis TaxID=2876027 RepID=UPI001CC0E2F0|nr:ABC transporter permease [Streptomyces huiliensis]MBZ4319255.1 ABC transporter permease [Streptomyces huiliensis]